MKMRWLMCLVGGLMLASLGTAQEKTNVPAGTPVTIIVKPAEPATPSVSLILGSRKGVAIPHKSCCAHTAGGNIDVQQPSSDTIVVTLTGAAVACGCPSTACYATLSADLLQCFEVSFDKPEVKAAKLTIEGRVVGLLRSPKKGKGVAEQSSCAEVLPCDGAPILGLTFPNHTVSCGESLSVNDKEGPCSIGVGPGKYKLHASLTVAVDQPKCFSKAASSEFAPDAIDPLWISYWEPFRGAAKKDFGLQVTIKVAEETVAEEKKNGNGEGAAPPKMEKADKPEALKPPQKN